jgi:hypothetical protein
MKLTIEKQFGNFMVTAAATVALPEGVDSTVKELTREGLLHIFERAPSSAVEQEVFGPLLGWEKTSRGSYKRPSDFKRNSEPFSQTVAERIKSAYETTPGKVDGKEVVFEVVSIVEYEGAEKEAGRKNARKMIDEAGSETRGMLCKMVGADEDASDEELVEIVHAKFFGKK